MLFKMDLKTSTLTALLSLFLMLELVCASDQLSDIFHVKPGAGPLSVEHELNNYKCKFSYAGFGGTHEEWTFSLELLRGSGVMCMVERASSYIYFDHFKMELTGPSISISEVDLMASQQNNKNLSPEEYTKSKTEVSSTDKFGKKLEKVAVFSSLQHDDL